LKEVYARLGITQDISYGNFPEIHRAIAARHRKFQWELRHPKLPMPSTEQSEMLGNRVPDLDGSDECET
jgi:hypothetical protein